MMRFCKLGTALCLVLTLLLSLGLAVVPAAAQTPPPRDIGDINGDGTVDIDDILDVRRDMFGEQSLAGDDLAAALALTPDGIDIDTILAIRSIMFGTYSPGPTAAPTAVATPLPPVEGEGPVRTQEPFAMEPLLGGDTYYVSTAGNNANDGKTLETAWLTLQYAVNTIRDGDTILVAGGDYAGFHVSPMYSGDPDDGWKCIKALDPANKPRITSAQTTSTGRPSFVQFWGNSRESGIRKAIYVKYWVVDGLVADNTANDRNDPSLNVYGFDFVIASNMIIRNCEAYNSYLTGIFCSMVDNFVAENNISEGNREHGFYFNCGGDNFVFRRNISKDNDNCGFHLNGGYHLPIAQDDRDGIHRNGLYEFNINSGNGAGGGASFNLSGLRGGIVRNNLSFNERASGITLFAGNASDTSRDVEIYNNTILLARENSRAVVLYDGNNKGHWCSDCPAGSEPVPPHNETSMIDKPLNTFFYNNIFGYVTPPAGNLVSVGTGTGGGPRLNQPNVIFRGNLFIGTQSTGYVSVPASTLTILRNSNTFEPDVSKIFVNPGVDHSLKPDSPAIGCGVYIPSDFSPFDNSGIPRDPFNRDAGALVYAPAFPG